jgi:hypothetical protein
MWAAMADIEFNGKTRIAASTLAFLHLLVSKSVARVPLAVVAVYVHDRKWLLRVKHQGKTRNMANTTHFATHDFVFEVFHMFDRLPKTDTFLVQRRHSLAQYEAVQHVHDTILSVHGRK